MFDIAYLNEASIEAGKIEMSKIWNKLTCLKGLYVFLAGMKWNDLYEIVRYYEIMFFTHGT